MLIIAKCFPHIIIFPLKVKLIIHIVCSSGCQCLPTFILITITCAIYLFAMFIYLCVDVTHNLLSIKIFDMC